MARAPTHIRSMRLTDTGVSALDALAECANCKPSALQRAAVVEYLRRAGYDVTDDAADRTLERARGPRP